MGPWGLTTLSAPSGACRVTVPFRNLHPTILHSHPRCASSARNTVSHSVIDSVHSSLQAGEESAFLVPIPDWKHLFPFRTQQLSSWGR